MTRRRAPTAPDVAAPDRRPARRRVPKAEAPADVATPPPTQPARKRGPRPPAQVPLGLPAGPRIIVGIDPGAIGAAVVLRADVGPPTLIAAVTWTERQRKTGTVYVPTWWPPMGGSASTMHNLGVRLARLADEAAGRGWDLDELPIVVAVERQFIGRFAGAGLGVAWLAGLIAGPVGDVATGGILRPAPAEWRAVAAPMASQRRKRKEAGDTKPCPSAMGAQLRGGWPIDLLTTWGQPEGSSGAGLPVDLGEALGIALWATEATR